LKTVAWEISNIPTPSVTPTKVGAH
jgi:hypothetical protein